MKRNPWSLAMDIEYRYGHRVQSIDIAIEFRV